MEIGDVYFLLCVRVVFNIFVYVDRSTDVASLFWWWQVRDNAHREWHGFYLYHPLASESHPDT